MRKRIPVAVERAVLTNSRRRCCLCFHFSGDLSEKKGQIAHLDHDPSNNAEANLAFLCLNHHDEYDRGPGQAKTLREHEVVHARSSLLECLASSTFSLPGASCPQKTTGPRHNLPQPEYMTLIGRSAELETIHRLLGANARPWIVLIDGIGGIGKTALALEAARAYCRPPAGSTDDNYFEYVIWVSAKTEILTADGVHKRRTTAATLTEICRSVLAILRPEELLSLRPSDFPDVLLGTLSLKRTLLVVDNLETVDDEQVYSFLLELPSPTKCVVTSRHRIDVAYPIRLTALKRDDGLSLIAEESERKKLQLHERQRQRLYDRTAGVPLAVVWSVAQIAYGHDVETVLTRLGHPSTDITRYCFEASLQVVKASKAWFVLLAIVLAERPINREDLGYVTGLSDLDRDDELVRLETLSLINKQQGRFFTLALVNRFVLHEMRETPLDQLEGLIRRMAEKDGPSAFFTVEATISLSPETRDFVAMQVDRQLWYDLQYGDEQGLWYSLAALGKIGNERCRGTLRGLVEGGWEAYGYITFDPRWVYGQAAEFLASLLDVPYLLGLMRATPKADWSFVFDALLKAGGNEVASQIREGLPAFEFEHAEIANRLRSVVEQLAAKGDGRGS